MGWNSYLDSMVTRVAGVSGINRAVRAAVVDVDKLVANPRWPTAIIVDEGGSIDSFSGDIYVKRFSVSVAVFVPRGNLGTEASKKLAELSEAITSELTHTRDHGEVTLYGELSEVASSADGREVYIQTMFFEYLVIE